MQVVNNSNPFQTPNSGTGAVIFDYPNEQPLDMLLKANQDIDNWQRQKAIRAAQQSAERAKMFADIKFDAKGALAEDIRNAITPEANATMELAAKVFSLPQDSPEFMQGMVELKRRQANVDLLINESTNHKDIFAETNKPLDPTKVDVEETNTRAAIARSLPLKQRIEFLNKTGSLIVPHKTSLDEIILEGTKQATLHPTTVGDIEVKNIGGHYISQENTETIPYEKALTLANGWINNNYKPSGATAGFKDKIYNTVSEWKKLGVDANGVPLDPNAKYYFEKAQTTKGANGETYTPAELYGADEIYKYNAKNIVRQNIGADAYAQEAKKLQAQSDNDAKEGGALVDLVSGVFQGKPQLFKPAKVTINGVEKDAVKTDALNTYKLGQFPIAVKDGENVGVVNVDNYILETLRGADGKIYVKTTETFNKSQTDPAVKKNPYITFNNEAELYNAIGGGLPEDKREKVLNSGREYAKKKGAYTDATSFNGAKIANVTPAERNKMNAMYGIAVEQVPNTTSSATPTKEQLEAGKKTTPKQTGKKTIPTVTTKAAFDALPSGAQYYNSKGILVTKG